MKRITLLCALFALLGTAGVCLQQLSLSKVRSKSVSPGFASVPVTSGLKSPESSAIDQEAALLREQAKDLPRLRNEVSQLRAKQSELIAARLENARLLEAKQTGAPVPRETPPGFVSKEQLRNAGYETPEDTIQTMFWAMREGNLPIAMECFSPEHRERIHYQNLPPDKRQQDEASFARRGASSVMKNFNDFTIGKREELSEDSVALHMRSSLGTNTVRFQFKRFGQEWKLMDF